MSQHPTAGEQPWWRHAVCYQVYIRSFADSDGNGIGDLAGITTRLPHLAALGVDALWITPFYTSPQYDHGYDVTDYRDVDPLFGSLTDFDALMARAHDLGLRVIVDLVPNHTSSAHAWFRAALEAAPGSPERARYLFRDGVGDDPPNNWTSVFGGPAWTRVPFTSTDPDHDAQWYLHLFDTTQPDLDWRNPEVAAMFEDVLHFWLDRGVDGFRVDVTHGLFKEIDLPDQRLTAAERSAASTQDMIGSHPAHEPMWDQPEVHDIYRSWRRILDSYPGERIAVGEAWTRDAESLARYIRPDELHQSFNFHWLSAPWSATAFGQVIESTLAAVHPVGGSATWVLSNHDVVRHPTRYGGGTSGLARSRAATMAMLALPGSSYLYQGEELGLEEVDVPPESWQDPQAGVAGKTNRDGCRVPLPWSGDAPPYGFGPGTGQPWIPQPAEWESLTVSAQEDDASSTLSFYRQALVCRRGFATTAGDDVHLLDLGTEVLGFVRGPLTVVLNCGTTTVALPAGEVLLASGALAGGGADLPPDTAVWLIV